MGGGAFCLDFDMHVQMQVAEQDLDLDLVAFGQRRVQTGKSQGETSRRKVEVLARSDRHAGQDLPGLDPVGRAIAYASRVG
jgi:hypothetical protein